jgi:hypothetical protein
MNNRPPAPTIPLLKNNAIDLEELGGALLNTFARYDSPEDGDALYPSWWGRSAEGEPIDYANEDVNPVYYDHSIVDPEHGMPMPMENGLVHRVDRGEVFYSYLLERVNGLPDDKVESNRIFFYVGKRDLLPAPQIKESHDEHLDPELGVTDFIPVAPPYRAMSKGDTVIFKWEGITSTGAPLPALTRTLTVTDEHIGNVLKWSGIPKTEATKIKSGRVKLSYTINYAAPTLKPSAVSAQRQLIIVPPVTPTLEAVRIKEFSGDTLDPTAYPKGITLLVTPWQGIRSGDTLILYWIGGRADRTVIKSQNIDLSNIDTDKIEIHLEHKWLAVNDGYRISVSYQYLRADASGASEVRDLGILAPLDLLAPIVEDALLGDDQVDGKLDTQFFAMTGVNVSIPSTVVIPEGMQATMHWNGFGSPYEVTQPVDGSPKKFNFPEHVIPPDIARIVEVYYSVKPKDAPIGTPGSPSKPYKLSVLKIPQDRLGVIVCDKASIGNPGILKRSAVPAGGVSLTFRPSTWIYIAEAQTIRMWLTGPGSIEKEIIASRHVTKQETVNGVRDWLRPEHLQPLADGQQFSIWFSVSFDGGVTDTLFKTLSLQLQA